MNYLKFAIQGNSIKSYIDSLNQTVNRVKRINGKNKLYIMADIVLCAIKYSASPNNYYSFRFFEIDGRKRNTYVTHGLSKEIIAKYNDNAYRDIFEDKIKFAKKFSQFYGREWVSLKDLSYGDFERFIRNKNIVIYKPVDLAQGQGIKRIIINEFRDFYAMWECLKTNYGNNGILEEWINQHEKIAKLYSGAVNCLRIITIYKNGKLNMLTGGLTIGNGREIANASCGDMVAPVDLETGIIKFPAEDMLGNIYTNHPITGEKIEGFQVPYWDEVANMLSCAAKLVPQVCYVGWDIAITPTKPILIEGNTSPGYKFYQLPSHLPDHIGNKSIYEKFL
jgi:hypothetical protein